MSSTRRTCFSLTIGPSWTSSRYGSPVRSRPAFSVSASVYSSETDSWTMCRPAAKQTWPWNWNDENAPADAAASRSASSRTMKALLPPSSSETFFSRAPASSPTRRPATVDPVKEISETFGSVTSASPTSAPPTTIWSSPSGSPASRKTASNIAPPMTGVCGSGFMTTALPSASAGATTRIPSTLGEFHGVMAPTTPDRDAPDHREAALDRCRHERPVGLPGERRCREDLAVGEVRLVVHLAVRGAGLAHRPDPELLAVGLVDVRGASQDPGPFLVRGLGPGRLGCLGRGSGARDVVDGAARTVEMRRPVAGSRSSMGSPVPGSQVETKEPSQPVAADAVGSGAIVAIRFLLRATRRPSTIVLRRFVVHRWRRLVARSPGRARPAREPARRR